MVSALVMLIVLIRGFTRLTFISPVLGVFATLLLYRWELLVLGVPVKSALICFELVGQQQVDLLPHSNVVLEHVEDHLVQIVPQVVFLYFE